jgi:DNA replication protein DnaC
MSIILSDECYLKDKCAKYQSNPSAECKFSNSYCPKLFRVNFLLQEGLLTDKQKKFKPLFIDADGTDREEFKQLQLIETHIEQFVSEGANLFIHSSGVGNGKTSWAIRLLQSYVDKIWYKSDLTCKILFVNVPRYLLALKDSISNTNEYADHIKKNILKADLVVFDEIATKGLSTFEHENVISIINARIDENKSNIYTSNLYGRELKEKLGDRLYSRIINLSTDIELHGQDKRGIR